MDNNHKNEKRNIKVLKNGKASHNSDTFSQYREEVYDESPDLEAKIRDEDPQQQSKGYLFD